MVTAIEKNQWTRKSFTLEDDLLDQVRAGRIPPKRQAAIVASIKEAWRFMIKTQGIPRVPVPKRLAEAQLHLKTGLTTEATYEERIERLGAIAASTLASNKTPEEKFILTRECMPEAPSDGYKLAGVQVSQMNGFTYVLGGLVLNMHMLRSGLTGTLWLEDSRRSLQHRGPFNLICTGQ